MSQSRKKPRRPQSLRVWHRWLGVVSALFVFLLAFSGLLLNHSETLRLAQRGLPWSWLQASYGIHVDPPAQGYPGGRHWFSAIDGQIYLDGQRLDAGSPPLTGGLACGGILAVADLRSLWLLLPDGEVIEKLGLMQLPGAPQALACGNERLLLRAKGEWWMADAALLGWQAAPETVAGARPERLPAALARAVASDHRARLLDAERVLLDLHSGRLFGRYGALLMDTMAVIFIVMAITGLWMWLRHYRRGRRRP